MITNKYSGFCLCAFIALMIAASTIIAPANAASNNAAPTASAATAEPMNTIGLPADASSHSEVTTGRIQYGVRLSLTPSSLSVRVGGPMVLSLWLGNATEKTAESVLTTSVTA